MPSGSSDRGVGSSSLDWIRMEAMESSRSPGLEGSCGAPVGIMRKGSAQRGGAFESGGDGEAGPSWKLSSALAMMLRRQWLGTANVG